MNIERLYQIIRSTTVQLQKGDEIEGDSNLVKAVKCLKECDDIQKLRGGVVHIYAMPHESQAKDNIVKVDCHFIIVGVDKTKAKEYKDELIAILKTYPRPERLAGGPSYIEVGAEIGDQSAAFQLFALGQVLNLWQVITPKTLGITGLAANQLAESGMVMISGFKTA